MAIFYNIKKHEALLFNKTYKTNKFGETVVGYQNLSPVIVKNDLLNNFCTHQRYIGKKYGDLHRRDTYNLLINVKKKHYWKNAIGHTQYILLNRNTLLT